MCSKEIRSVRLEIMEKKQTTNSKASKGKNKIQAVEHCGPGCLLPQQM